MVFLMPEKFAVWGSLRAAWRGRQILREILALLPPESRPVLPFGVGFLLGSARGDLLARLTQWGPSYIKLGQFLATRPDLIGGEAAELLRQLQDKMPFFPQEEAQKALHEAFGAKSEALFLTLGEPVAAASIAQLHQAKIRHKLVEGGVEKKVAVKILRPNIESVFARDLAGFFTLARLAGVLWPATRRLKLEAVLTQLGNWVAHEMDLRLEAAALSELRANGTGQDIWHLPAPDWQRTGRRVLTLDWIEGIPPRDAAVLRKAGHNPKKIAKLIMRAFLTQALAHGFFHADMHAGNLFVLADGRLAAVDFGIMGRLHPRDRIALGWILHALVQRDYGLAAKVHLWAGYVPNGTDSAMFAQYLRAMTEPVFDLPAHEISMAALLMRLFETTAEFKMETRTGLLLLQKTMVAVEGLARQLDPEFDIWQAARSALAEVQPQMAPSAAALRDARARAALLLSEAPELLDSAEKLLRHALDETPPLPAKKPPRFGFWGGFLIAAGLAVLVWWLAVIRGLGGG